MNRKIQNGVTLIELMVALAVLAILVSAAVPSFVNLVKDTRMRSTVNALVTAMRVARSEAIKRGGTVSFCATDDFLNCAAGATRAYIVFSDSGTAFQVDGGDEVIYLYERQSNEPDIYSDPTDVVQFRATGRASDAPTFEFCDSRGTANARTVKLARTGRVSSYGHTGSETCS